MNKHEKRNAFRRFNNFFVFAFLIFVMLSILRPFETNEELAERINSKPSDITIKTLLNGKYKNKAENYVNENFIAKESLLYLKSSVERISGKKESNGILLCENGYLIEKPRRFDKKIFDHNCNFIKKISENNIKVTVALVPNAYEVLKDELPSNVYDDTFKKLNKHLTQTMSENEVNYVSSTSIFKRHKNDYLYYRTDPHITANGGYVMYHSLSSALNFEPLKSDDFKISDVSRSFLGENYQKTFAQTDPDIICDYKPLETHRFKVKFPLENIETDSMYFPSHLGGEDKYSYFLDGDHALTVIKSPNKNGKKIAVFKDSYANVVVPFVANHFEEMHLIDLSRFEENVLKYLKENNINDALFLYGENKFLNKIY